MLYDPTIYHGAAVHYRQGRPAYSPQLEAVVAGELGLNGSGRLLDGGCGPGIVTVRFAYLFEEAVGLDPDPAMLAEGRRLGEEWVSRTSAGFKLEPRIFLRQHRDPTD